MLKDKNNEAILTQELDAFSKIETIQEFEWTDGILGLNINFPEYERNLIYQMWLQKSINYPKFTILHTNKIDQTKLLLGDFSNDSNIILKTYLNKLNFCESTQQSIGWQCDISYLKIKHKKILTSNSKVKLDTLNPFTVIPEAIFNDLFEIIIEESKLNSKEDCKINKDKRLICKCEDPNLFPEILFKIENYQFKLNLREEYDFYFDDEYPCHFKIKILNLKEQKLISDEFNFIFLGTEAIKNSIFSFDLQKRKMGFNQLKDFEVDDLLHSLNNKKNLSTNIITEGNVYLKLIFFLAIIVILIILIGIYNCSNNFRFSFNWNKDDKEDEIRTRKSMDYYKLTDENYVHSSEKFKNRINQKLNCDFNTSAKELNDENNGVLNKTFNNSNSSKNKNYFLLGSSNRKESFVSLKNNSKKHFEMQYLNPK